MADTTPVGGLSATAPSAAVEEKDNATNIGSTGAKAPAALKINKNLSVPGVAGGMPVPPSILENLQKQYEERKAQKESFMENLRDATAWWSGGVAGPGEALAKRAAERNAQSDELFAMQSAIAQYKAAQERNQRIAQHYGAAPVAGTPGAVGVAGTPATNAAGGANNWRNIVAGLPTELQPGAALAAQNGEWDKFEGIVKEAVLKRSDLEKNLDLAKRTPGDADLIRRNAMPQGYGVQTGVGASGKKYEYSLPGTVPAGVLPPGEDGRAAPAATTTTSNVRGTAAADAIAAGVPVISGDRSNEKQWELYDNWVAGGRKGNPVARPGTSKHETGNAIDVDSSKLTTENKQWLADNGFVQTLPQKDPNHWERVVPAATTTTTTTTRPTAARQDVGTIAAEQKATETELTERAKDWNAARRDVQTLGKAAPDMLNSIGRVEQIMQTPEGRNAAGVLAKPGPAAALATLVKEGISAGNFGNVGFKGLESAVRQASGDQKTIDAAQKLAKEFASMQLNIAKRDLKGQGAVSDNERLIVAHVTGDIANSPKVIDDFMRWNRARTEYDRQVYDAHRRFEKANPNGSYRDFELSDEFRRLEDAYIAKTDEMVKTMDTSNTKVPHVADSIVEQRRKARANKGK